MSGMLDNPETMFKIDQLRKYKKIDEMLNKGDNEVSKKLNELKNPKAIQQSNQSNEHLLFAKLISLVMQKRVWNLDELAASLFEQKKDNQRKEVQRAVINAMRYKLVDGKINQEECTVSFTHLNAFFEGPETKDAAFIAKQLQRLI